MTDDDIFDLADQYGWMDDFGRWNFQPDRLVSFALAIKTAEWVGLTDDEVFNIYKQFDSLQYKSFAKAIEAKLKEKNA
ncbi:MAG: hypothetical protein EBR82_39180 [Caulobacteraceae bacterium]|nr:hypothetical protein [Caulobacteraceae bacterium]